jgi:uncharacterized protein (DUF58 family)
MPDAAPTSPGVYVDIDHLIGLEQRGRKVSLLPRQPVHSLLSGRYASRMRGRGLNFEEIRDYRPGDDVRAIDWKVTVRLQKPHVRVFNEERDRQGILVVDQRLSMFFGSQRAMKSVTAAETATVIAWRVLNVGDRIGAVLFNDSDIVDVRPRRSRATVLQLLGSLARQNRALGIGRGITRAPAMLNQALDRVRRLAAHDATVVIVSDFDGADDATRDAVAAIAAHNDVVAILVHDPLQSQLPASGRMTVTDGELQIVLDVGRGETRSDILAMSQTRLRSVLAWTPDLGIPVLPVSTAEEPVQQLHRLLGLLPQSHGRTAPGATAGAAHG